MTIDWNHELLEQFDWHWKYHVRPRLDGLTDEEYVWEPVAGCWNIRPDGNGGHRADWAHPEPQPVPVTTIAWRLGHIITGVLGERAASHFGGPPADAATFAYAGTADEALKQLDDAYGRWYDGVRALGADGLARPCGPAEGPFAEYPMASLVLHINREMIHHCAEVLTLRDLYRARG